MAVTILFPETFDVLTREARGGIVFHKSPEGLLLREKKSSHLLNDYDSTSCPVCIVRRQFEAILLGKLMQRHYEERDSERLQDRTRLEKISLEDTTQDAILSKMNQQRTKGLKTF